MLLTEKDLRAALKELEMKAAPHAARIDEENKIPESIRELLWRDGLLDLVPLDGGEPLNARRVCAAVEHASKVSAALGLLLIVQAVGALPVFLAGSAEQKKFYAGEIAAKKFMAFALTETKSGSDAQSIQTRGEKTKDGYVLSGSKIFVTNGELAHHFVIFAQTGSGEKPAISAFAVQRGDKGLEVGPRSELTGMRGVPTTFLTLRNVKVAEKNRIGREGDGFKIAMKTLDISRPFIAAQAVGIAQASLEAALQFSRKRILFGKPISDQQGIQFMLSDMATGIEAARSLVRRAARSLDEGEKHASRYSAMAKYFASDMAVKVTTDAFQILGGYGCIKGNPVERMARDAKITQIFEGTNQIQRIVVARSLLKDDGQ